MNRVYPFSLYELGRRIGRFVKVAYREGGVSEILAASRDLEDGLSHFIQDAHASEANVFVPFQGATREAAIMLRAGLGLFQDYKQLEDDRMRKIMWEQIYPKLSEFEIALSNDLRSLPLFHVSQKLAFETDTLINEAERVFPDSIRLALPTKVKDDIRAAGRCLGFGLSSAVGFHVLRAIELLVLDYFTLPGWDRSDATTWGGYVKRLRHYRVHRKIVAMIDRLATLHRNELMHAEAVLSVEEAAVLFALVQEVAPLMIADVAKRKGSPIADFPILNDPRWEGAGES